LAIGQGIGVAKTLRAEGPVHRLLDFVRAFSPHENFWHNPAALPLAGINPRLWRFGPGARGKDPEATHLSKSVGRGGSPSGPKPQAAKPPSNDFPREGACRASHYYSLTRLETTGTVRIGERTHQVSGLTWFDHEWATNQLAAHQTGWDWFSLHFENGAELMLFQIRTKDGGRDPFSSGTWIGADGTVEKIPRENFELEPIEWWKSPKTGGRYPVAWTVSIPSRNVDLTVRARFPAQELDSEPFSYWEGAVSAEGSLGADPLRGKGYLEMTGYAGGIVGMQAK
jgi:hypothetical protein